MVSCTTTQEGAGFGMITILDCNRLHLPSLLFLLRQLSSLAFSNNAFKLTGETKEIDLEPMNTALQEP